MRADDEILALEREGSVEECAGMPMLSLMREFDQDMMDFMVAAWCVMHWGDVGKRVRRMSKGTQTGGKLLGKFHMGS